MPVHEINRTDSATKQICDRQGTRIRELETLLRSTSERLQEALRRRTKAERTRETAALREEVEQGEQAIAELCAKVTALENQIETMAETAHELLRERHALPPALDVPFRATPQAYRDELKGRFGI